MNHDESGCIVKQIRYDVSMLGRSILSSESSDGGTNKAMSVSHRRTQNYKTIWQVLRYGLQPVLTVSRTNSMRVKNVELYGTARQNSIGIKPQFCVFPSKVLQGK